MFLATAVYFSISDGELFLIFDQVEYLENSFRKLCEKGVVSKSELELPLNQLTQDPFRLAWLTEDCPENPILCPEELKKVRIGVNTISYVSQRTRPELGPALGQIARGQSAAGRKRFLQSLALLLRYLFTTRTMTSNVALGIRVTDKSSAKVPLVACLTGIKLFETCDFDASLGSVCARTGIVDGFARQGCFIFLGLSPEQRALVMHRCGLASTVSTSTTEAELGSCNAAAREVLGINNIYRKCFRKQVCCFLLLFFTETTLPRT